MTYFEIGAGVTVGLGVIGWIAITEFRIRSLSSSLLRSEEALKDAQITAKTNKLSDAELDGLLKSDIGPGDSKN